MVWKKLSLKGKNMLFLLFVTGILQGCNQNVNNLKFNSTEKVNEELVLLKYEKKGGIFTNDCYYVFLTDSSTFKILVGTHGNDAGIYARQHYYSNRVSICLSERDVEGLSKETVYDLDSLKSLGNFNISSSTPKE